MEKIVTQRSLKNFGERENPWKNRSYEERFIATAVISGATRQHGTPEPGFSRIHRVYKIGEG